jgi:predicted  nucleic acid-binding Zn-ribbon protein
MEEGLMYRCERCGEIFDSPDEKTTSWIEYFWGAPCRAEYTEELCPWCGSDDFERYDEEEEGESEYAEAV